MIQPAPGPPNPKFGLPYFVMKVLRYCSGALLALVRLLLGYLILAALFLESLQQRCVLGQSTRVLDLVFLVAFRRQTQ
jgi:hypothetical protein